MVLRGRPQGEAGNGLHVCRSVILNGAQVPTAACTSKTRHLLRLESRAGQTHQLLE